MTDLLNSRRQKDQYFRHSSESPIPADERASFAGLRYFPENSELRLLVQVEQFDPQEPVRMLTSTGGVQDYLRWGRFSFEVDGQAATLVVYYASWGGYFVPFVDATSGHETYGAGRYLELEAHADGSFLADFNVAYNPYCAYSEEYSCPIPPAENRIGVPIRAGEMVYGEGH